MLLFAMYRPFVNIIFLLLILLNKAITNTLASAGEWSSIESLAEDHPYVIALLNDVKEYMCTGTIIDKRTVLTTGSCISPEPQYVAVGAAVLGNTVNNNSIFHVAFVKLHGDYILEFQDRDPRISRMHSNIGLVFVARPILDYFVESAIIGNYYASELKEKKLIMVGFGNIRRSEAVALQHQAYHQIACKNPKWYYCVCGIEYAVLSYDEPFGEGAPVLYGDEVVGIAVSPTGSMMMKTNINYNIFTVIGPYLAWIDKSKFDSLIDFRATHKNQGAKIFIIKFYFFVLIVFIKFII